MRSGREIGCVHVRLGGKWQLLSTCWCMICMCFGGKEIGLGRYGKLILVNMVHKRCEKDDYLIASYDYGHHW